MRVLSLVPTLGPGGAEAFAVDLACGLARKAHKSSLHIAAEIRGDRGSALLKKLEHHDIRVTCAGLNSPRKILRASYSLAESIISHKPDILLVHLTSCEVLASISTLLTGQPRTPLIRVIHQPRIDVASRFLSPRFSASVAVSRETLRQCSQNRFKTLYIPNGLLDSPKPMPTQARFSAELRLAMVGHFRGGPQGSKGLDIALQALARINERQPALLHLFGTPPEDLPLLDEMALGYGIKHRLKCHGVVPDLSRSLHTIRPDMALMPSRIEGESIALMEFSALGLPVVLSDIQSFRDMVDERLDWTFFNTGDPDALVEAVINRSKSPPPEETYPAHSISRFSMDRTIAEYETLISTLTKQ